MAPLTMAKPEDMTSTSREKAPRLCTRAATAFSQVQRRPACVRSCCSCFTMILVWARLYLLRVRFSDKEMRD